MAIGLTQYERKRHAVICTQENNDIYNDSDYAVFSAHVIGRRQMAWALCFANVSFYNRFRRHL